jgi:hypothetical protein
LPSLAGIPFLGEEKEQLVVPAGLADRPADRETRVALFGKASDPR